MHDGKITPGDVIAVTIDVAGQLRVPNGWCSTKFMLQLVDELRPRRVYVEATNSEGGTPFVVIQDEVRYLDPYMQHRLLTFS
jgi:hypothetical protein